MSGHLVAVFRIAAWLASATALVAPGGALAHAMFTGSSPAANSALAESPGELRLDFSEAVTPVSLGLVDQNGAVVAGVGRPVSRERSVVAAIPALPPGLYLVSYRVISEDAHPVAASFAFSVGSATPGAVLTARIAPDIDPWRAPVYVTRVLYILALLLATGSALVLVWLRPGGSTHDLARRTATSSAVAGIALALATIALAGLEMTGGRLSSLLQLEAWRVAATSTLGRSVSVAIIGLLTIAWFTLRLNARGAGIALTTGALVVASSRGLTGHPATTEPVALIALTMTLHFLAAGLWFGSLLPLRRAVSVDEASVAAAFLERFSRVALMLVPALLLVGVIMAYVQVASFTAMVETSYGRSLSLKLLGVACLLGLAALNKQRHTPALARNQSGTASALHRLIAIEWLIMVVVIALSAQIASTPPPREMLPGADASVVTGPGVTAAGPRKISGTITQNATQVMWQLDPARSLEFTISANGEPVDLIEANVTLTPTGTSIEPLTLAATRIGPGRYRANAAAVALAGPWHLSIEALVTDFDRNLFEAGFAIGPEQQDITTSSPL